jgi:transposase
VAKSEIPAPQSDDRQELLMELGQAHRDVAKATERRLQLMVTAWEGGTPMREIADVVEVSVPTVHAWIQRSTPEGGEAPRRPAGTPYARRHRSARSRDQD